MRYKISLLNILFFALAFNSNAIAGSYSDLYDCPEGGEKRLPDNKWGFIQCNCTSYVAYKLNEAGIPFNNWYPDGKNRWSDAGKKWETAANNAGISHDKIPRAGDVAYWVTPGHVAYVESVAVDGKTVTISEYNWCKDYLPCTPPRTINVNNPSGYIHFNGIQPVTPTPETESPFRCVLGDTICWSPPDSSCVNSQLLIYKGVKYYNDGTWKMMLACNSAYKDAVSEGLSADYWHDVFLGHNDIFSIGMCRQ